MKKRSVKKSERLVKQYAPLFGLGHYKWSVTPIPEDHAAPDGELWGCSAFDHSEEHFDIAVVPDGVLGDEQHKHLILHELAHGIINFANLSEAHCETACDRIAKLVGGDGTTGPNYSKWAGPNRVWDFEEADDDKAIARIIADVHRSRSRKDWDEEKAQRIARILDSLPDLSDREKYVLGALYVQGLSFRQVAKALGVSARTVTRIRNQMVKRLSEVA